MFATNESSDARTAPDAKKMLVVYFSHSGNTRAVAEQIARTTGADLFGIVPQKAYPAEYRAVVDQAKQEVNTGHRPVLKNDLPEAETYDVIFVGSPCWWYTIAPPVATFLASHDFTGKTLVPFMTHEGSRMGHSEKDIAELAPKATLLEGLPVRGGSAASAEPTVRKWLQKLGLTD